PSFKSQLVDVADIRGRYEVWTESTGVGKVFARNPLAGCFLPVTHRKVVVVRVAGDVVKRICTLDTPRLFTDDQGHFAFVVELGGRSRFDGWCLVTHVGVSKTGEDRGCSLAGLTGFFLVGTV